jgi:outer membrane protein assembly factor BamB
MKTWLPICCFAVALGSGETSSSLAEVPMFRGGPQHTGSFDAVGVPSFSKVKWQFQTGAAVFSSPAVVGNTVYVGSNDHKLYALQADTGALLWKFETKSRVTSSPAVADGTVYFGSYDGNFYALDARTGEPKWQFATGGERRYAATHLHGAEPAAEVMPDPFDVYLSSPVVWDGTVYFGCGDGFVYALDAASGRLRWRFRTGDVVHSSPAIADGALYVGSWDSLFYALDAKTGQQRWHLQTGVDPLIHNQIGIQSSPAVAEGMVFFGCRDSNLYAVDAKTGVKKWTFNNHGSWVIGSPAVRDGKVYFATSDSGLFHVVEAASGSEIFSLDFKHWPMFSSPALAGERAYVGSHDGRLLAINLQSHTLAWAFQTEAAKRVGPTYTKADGSPNYLAAYPDFFYDNVVAGVQKLLSVGAILSSPVVEGNVIYVGSADGNVYALQ